MKLFKQETEYSCGPASIRMAISRYISSIPCESSIIELSKCNHIIGTTRSQMIKTVRKLGFTVFSKANGTLEHLSELLKSSRTIIILFSDDINSFHYSIIYAITEESITIADPWIGNLRSISINDFKNNWYCYNGTIGWYMSIKD